MGNLRSQLVRTIRRRHADMCWGVRVNRATGS